MTIDVGDRIPEVTLQVMGETAPQPITPAEIFNGKRVVLFGVPGAFTPGCSKTHLPGFVVHADTIKSRGIDSIVCMSVNDAFVMHAWGKDQNADEILMLADGNGELTRQLGLEMDATAGGLGMRCRRFAAIVDDGVVSHLAVETEKGVNVSGAEHILEHL